MRGCVTSLFDPSQNARVLIGPDDAQIDISASKTHGVNEGIAYAVANNWGFECHPHEVIACTDAVTIPPCADADIDLMGSDFSFTGNAPALKMNSFNGGRFHHSGRLIYQGSASSALSISPFSADPKHGQKIIQNSEIYFGNIQISGVNVGAIALLDLSAGSIINNKSFEFLDLTGWDGANRAMFGIQVTVPGNASIGFNENGIKIGQLTGFSSVGILNGSPSPYAVYLSDNEWDVMLNSNGAVNSMIQTYGSDDEWRISATIYTGTCISGLVFQPGANDNSYKIRQMSATYPVQDFGTGNRAI